MSEKGDLAVVLSGGGARAAYQAGFLHGVALQRPDLRVRILTGVSAGAINAAALANHRGRFVEATADLCHLWRSVTTDRVLRVDTRSLLAHLLRWAVRLLTGGLPGAPPVRGLVDTAPLREFLTSTLRPEAGVLGGVRRNLAEGRLRALAVTTTSYLTGQTVTWVQGREIRSWERPLRRGVQTEISVDHVMASAALPLFFPAIQIGATWHGDGGIRLAAPLAPAIHLGARRILAVSTMGADPAAATVQDRAQDYPPAAQILGLLLDAIFIDALGYDAHLLERNNRLIAGLPEEKRHGVCPIELYVARPACDIGTLAARFEPQLPRAFRVLTRGFGTREAESPDSLSLIMFEPGYLACLIAAGEADAERQRDEIARVLG